MIGRLGTLGAGVLLLGAACAQDPAGLRARGRIAGNYLLMSVDGRLPSSPVPDSADGTVTVLGGQLTLGGAAPERYVYTPAGAMSGSCVHEIPDGAFVDTANVVHLPDGSSYRIPPCGDGPYTLRLTRQHVAADGTQRILTDSIAGLYTWGTVTASDTVAMVTLVGSGLGGSVTFTGGTVLRVARLHLGMPLPEPVYLFAIPGGDKLPHPNVAGRSERRGG